MDNIYIDYEQGPILGTKIQGEANDLKNLLLELEKIQEKLSVVLKDSNDEQYLKAVSAQTKIMSKLAEAIDETGNFLVDVSNAYQEAADANCNSIN